MAANVESMFYTRKAPWHGLGVRVEEVLGSKEALIQAGLDWKVEQTDVYAASGERISGYKANIRDIDRSVLGIVGDRYKIVQNEEAFAFTDGLLGEGVKYETAGSLAGGKIVWMLAKLPEKYIISGDAIEPYLVFCNSHDGSGAIRVAMNGLRRCAHVAYNGMDFTTITGVNRWKFTYQSFCCHAASWKDISGKSIGDDETKSKWNSCNLTWF